MENIFLHNPHSGEILKYEFLEEFDISENTLAGAIGISSPNIHNIALVCAGRLCLCSRDFQSLGLKLDHLSLFQIHHSHSTTTFLLCG